MKFKEYISDVKSTGDVEENNISIDVNNLDFVIQILSTNLYSNPIESLIREIVSNAWDSHIEAGIDEPVLLELGKDTEENYFCRIQDFGVGISPERFNKIYRNIGSSTKRGSNNEIGGFGIGRFSSLSYTDVVYITSNHDNITYKYIMYKDGNKIKIDLLNQQATTERNGVEVYINIASSDDYHEFLIAIRKQLVYFENLYVIDNVKEGYNYRYSEIQDFANKFNSFKIKKYNNFLVNTLTTTDCNLLLGKVLYPLRFNSLSSKYHIDRIRNYPISLRFEIGDLEITPNREEITYSKENIKKIENKIDNVKEEINDLIEAVFIKDYDNIWEYYDMLRENKFLCLLKHDGIGDIKIKVDSNLLENKNITFNGKAYNKDIFISIFKDVITRKIPFFSQYRVRNGSIRKNVAGIYYKNATGIYYNNFSALHEDIKNQPKKIKSGKIGDLSSITKSYLRTTKKFEELLIIHFSLTPIEYYKNYLTYFEYNKQPTSLKYFKVIFKEILKSVASIKEISNSKVPTKWLEKRKKRLKKERDKRKSQGYSSTEKITLYNIRNSTNYNYGKRNLVYDSETHKIKDLHKNGYFKKLTIFGEKGDPNLEAVYSLYNAENTRKLNRNRVKCIALAPTRIKKLKDLKHFINIKDFMKELKLKKMRDIGTLYLLEKKVPHLTFLLKIDNLNSISTKLNTLIQDLKIFKTKFEPFSIERNPELQSLKKEIYKFCKKNNYFNEDIRGLIVGNKKLLKYAKILPYFVDNNYHSGTSIRKKTLNVLVDYILTKKLFTPSVEAVKKLREETIFNIIKENENESN